MDLLKQMLDTINVTYHERMFETKDGIAGLGSEPFVSDYKTLHLYVWYAVLIILDTPSQSKDTNYRIHIIATYAVHARPLLCEVAPPTNEQIHEACLHVYFSSVHVLPTGQHTGPSLPSSPAPYLWVVCSWVVASRGSEFTLHCTAEGECVEQIPRFSPVWFHWGSAEHEHRHWHRETPFLLVCTPDCTHCNVMVQSCILKLNPQHLRCSLSPCFAPDWWAIFGWGAELSWCTSTSHSTVRLCSILLWCNMESGVCS